MRHNTATNITLDRQAPAEDSLPLIRSKVKDILSRNTGFRKLPVETRSQIAHDMVKVANYIVDANGETSDAPINAVVSSVGNQQLARPMAEGSAPDTAGADFTGQGGATAADAGVNALGNMINKADFPGFVGGLIDGVFNAVVTASIDQMQAYAELVANVAKSVDEYMRDNVTEDQARDYLVEKYPDQLEADLSGEQGRVKVKPDADDSNVPDFMKELGLPFPLDDLDDDTVEEQLVPAARKRMAMDRQQLLATMVLMGLNRIVVTDGKISASVVFTLDTIDAIEKSRSRNLTFEAKTKSKRKSNRWFRPKTSYNVDTKLNIETTQDDDSEAGVELKTTMKGNVDLRFKSETFPLDKMVDMLGVNQETIQNNSNQKTVDQPA